MMYRDDRGPIQLGRRLGQGGEGTVYEMGGEAVKIYTAPPSADRAEKIRALLTVRTGTLEAVSAWPNRLVYAGRNPVGYVMPKISDHQPISRISLPASRKQHFPEMPWGWLIHIARNLAAAVEQIHTAGVVIGDLSEANIFVASSAFVRMIDVDSFQISVNGKLWNTGVGVPMFLPPELQGRDLRSVQRTKNHDAFGLAVMIFQLLMMGRHPWGGNYRNDKNIEDLIATEPFAYGQAARARGMTPPKISPKMEWLQSDIATAFERAFSSQARPTAHDWAVALDVFRGALTTCTVSSTHQFVPTQGKCPWCRLEQHDGIFYFLPSTTNHRQPESPTFAIGALEKQLLAITLPDNFYSIRPKTERVHPSPPPPWLKSYTTGSRLATLTLIACTIVGDTYYGANALILGIFLTILTFSIFSPSNMANRHKKLAEQELAKLVTTWDELIAQWHAGGASPILELYESTKKDLRRYKSLSQLEVDELGKLKRRHREIMLDLHLSKHIIRDAKLKIPKKAIQSLEAYGIQTAADIKHLDTIMVPLIGTTRLERLREWKAQLIFGFYYDPYSKLPTWMTDEMKARYEKSRRDLEVKLPQQIQRLNFMIAKWEEQKEAQETPIREQAARILDQRATIAMWSDISAF
jgi:DNA-binding helix-hairpin-helix protein with protein kinase domain